MLHFRTKLTIFPVFKLSDFDIPDHDLDPPKFAKKAIERLLGDWRAVKTLILSGNNIELF